MARRKSANPGKCVVCGNPKHRADRPNCRTCSKLTRLVDRLLTPDRVPPRVGALRWVGSRPMEDVEE